LLFVQDTSDVDDALQIVGCQGATKGFLIQKGLKLKTRENGRSGDLRFELKRRHQTMTMTKSRRRSFPSFPSFPLEIRPPPLSLAIFNQAKKPTGSTAAYRGKSAKDKANFLLPMPLIVGWLAG